jgi:hypothetical protein
MKSLIGGTALWHLRIWRSSQGVMRYADGKAGLSRNTVLEEPVRGGSFVVLQSMKHDYR